MTTARQQAREAVAVVYAHDEITMSNCCAEEVSDAASDVWESIMQDIHDSLWEAIENHDFGTVESVFHRTKKALSES